MPLLSTRCSYGRSTPATKQRMLIPQSICWSLVSQLARGAEKGPNSREYSYKWLQSLRSIVIDNKRCPVACEEFINCEYDRDKEGNVISGYPDGNDHDIDAVRYAMERVWKRRGQ